MMFDGETFAPLSRFRDVAKASYGAGEVVMLAPVEDRSKKSHDHFFAVMDELWQTLPESLGDRYPNAEVFRKTALISTGHCDVRTLVCSSKAEAARVAAFMKPMDPDAIITVREAVVTAYTAHSQSMKAMGKALFQKSKDDCLGWAQSQIDSSQGAGGANNPARVAA